MNKTIVAWVFLSIMLTSPVWAKQAPSKLEGVYTQQKSNTIFNGKDWEDTKTTDCIAIHKTEDGLYELESQSVQTNAHICSLGAPAKLVGKTLYVQPLESDEMGNHDCKLRIDILPNQFVFHDPDNKCRAWNCGARAGFDEVKISRRHKTTWKAGQCIEVH